MLGQLVIAQPAGVYRDAGSGLSFRLAGGFGVLKQQDTLTILGSSETPGMVMIESGETFSSAELAEAARSGYTSGGLSLKPAGPSARLALPAGEAVTFPVHGALDGESIHGLIAGVRTPSNRCFIILAATTPASWPKLEPAARRMIESISLETPATGAHAYFAGSRLTFYMSRSSTSAAGAREGSFSGVERIYLCPGGSFHYGERTDASFDVPQAMGRANSADAGSGRWHAIATTDGASLSLSFHDGRQLTYRATRLGSETLYLNGSKYFRARHARCQ